MRINFEVFVVYSASGIRIHKLNVRMLLLSVLFFFLQLCVSYWNANSNSITHCFRKSNRSLLSVDDLSKRLEFVEMAM